MAQVAMPDNAGVIIDIGCGKGQLVEALAARYDESYCLGIDIDDDIYYARNEAKLKHYQNIQFVRADFMYLPLRRGCSQLIFCASVLEHLRNVQTPLREVSAILTTNGKFLVGVPTENRIYRIGRKLARLPRPLDHFHNGEYLKTMVEREFSLIRVLKLPSRFLPKFFSLYLIMVCTKRMLDV